MTDLRKVLFLYRQSNRLTQGEGGSLVEVNRLLVERSGEKVLVNAVEISENIKVETPELPN